MKTFPVLASVAASIAFIVYQFSFPVAVSLLFGAGVIAIAIADYAREGSALSAPRVARLSRIQRLRLAA